MAGVHHKFLNGPITYTVVETIRGGQGVEGRTGSVVGVSGANSLKFLGIATRDAIPSSVDTVNGTTPSGFAFVDTSGAEATDAIAYEGCWSVTYTAACAFGQGVKCAAAGAFAPWVDGTDTAGTRVGQSREPGGVAAAGPGLLLLNH